MNFESLRLDWGNLSNLRKYDCKIVGSSNLITNKKRDVR
jgi:hypothetical protein